MADFNSRIIGIDKGDVKITVNHSMAHIKVKCAVESQLTDGASWSFQDKK